MQPPIRCKQKIVIAMIALVGGPGIVGLLFYAGAKLLMVSEDAFGVLVSLLVISGGCLVAYLMFENFAWVELDQRTLRGKQFWTRFMIEHDIEDITTIVPMSSGSIGLSEVLLDFLLRTSNRGFLINFRAGPRLVLLRGDMSGVDDLIIALKDRLGDQRWSEVVRVSRGRAGQQLN